MNTALRSGLAGVVILLGAALIVPLDAAPVWVNATGNLANMASQCGNLTMLSAVPGSDTILAGVAIRGLWSNKSGTTWTHLGAGAGSARITNRPSSISYDPNNPSIFWESGTYNSGGVYRTADGGNTFQQLGSITFNDYLSVDFSDPGRQTLLAGGHEQSQTVYRLTNGGQNWTNVGLNLLTGTKFSGYPLLISSQIHLVSTAGFGAGTEGIHRTIDGGASWQEVSTLGPSGRPLVTSAGIIYWAHGDRLLKSADSGATWTQVGSGLQEVTPVELPDKRLASIGVTNLTISADGGTTWSPIGLPLPFKADGLIYSPQRQAFFVWHNDCESVVLPDAIMKLDWPLSSAPSPGK